MVLASATLGAVELAISVFLQLFLKSIGLLGPEVRTPFGALNPSPTILALALGVIALVRAAAQFFGARSGFVAMEAINARLRRLAVWDMLLQRSKRPVSASAVNARVGDLAVKASLFGYFGVNLVGSSIQAGALVPLMFITAARQTFVAMAGLFIVGIAVMGLNLRARRVAAKVPAELRVVTEGIARVASNTLLVRVLRTETIEHRRVVTAIDAYERYLLKAGVLGSVSISVPPFAGILLILAIIELNEYWTHTPGITLLAFLYLLMRFVGTISNIASVSSSCSTNWPAFKDGLDFFASFDSADVTAATLVGEELVGRSVERPLSAGGQPPIIELRDIHFTYPEATNATLDGVTCSVPAGSQLAVVGPSGCGKSTLVALLLGVIQPSAGCVFIGGRSPDAFFADPMTRVGYVGAVPFLIGGSVRENLRYGISVAATDSDLYEALRRARIQDVIDSLPGGLDYLIPEDGTGLSAGQKQRLCLARALLNRPHVLILDEASANLDVAMESEIAESVRALHGECTTVIVSHRKASLKYADQTLALGATE